MARILDLFLNRKSNGNCGKYPDNAALFDGLRLEAPDAIRCLSSKISGTVFKIGKQYNLTDEDIEELICDCITLCLQKIQNGQYVFQGYDPASFTVEIAKNKQKTSKEAPCAGGRRM